MKIKVCGMKVPENIQEVQRCEPDFLGFIFYEKSPRYVGDTLDISEINTSENTQKVGVFVNGSADDIAKAVEKNQLDFVQLHGNESVELVEELAGRNIKMIKAFQINESFNWSDVKPFVGHVDYFLFDTATKNYGGSGLKFDWKQLNGYAEETPFFLSGGITVDDLEAIKKLEIPQLYGVDINSKFETAPGIKNIELVKTMITELRNGSIIPSK